MIARLTLWDSVGAFLTRSQPKAPGAAPRLSFMSAVRVMLQVSRRAAAERPYKQEPRSGRGAWSLGDQQVQLGACQVPTAVLWQSQNENPARACAVRWRQRRRGLGNPHRRPRSSILHTLAYTDLTAEAARRLEFAGTTLNLVRPTDDQPAEGAALRCLGALCLMSLTTWTRPRRLALEPRCIGVAPSRPKLRMNFVTRGPNTSLTSYRL
jgi:hypothetical protein